MVTTPLDVIETLKGKQVTIKLKGGNEFTGKLVSFDLNSNIGIESEGTLRFIQGETVVSLWHDA